MNIINSYRYSQAEDNSLKMEFTTTVANTTVYLPIRSSDGSGRLVFDDGTSDVIGNADEATHTFTTAGTYVIKYYGTATSIAWGSASSAQKQFLTKILDWGITGATIARFTNCSSLISVASNLESTTTNLYRCFAYQSGNPDVTTLDTSNVTNMNQMFRNATSADPDMSSWDFSSATSYSSFLQNSGISTTNYDGFLVRLDAQRTTHSLTGRAIGDIPSTYTTATGRAPRTSLLANGWTLTDDGSV